MNGTHHCDPDRQRTLLAWSVWSTLRDMIVMDGDKLQRVADEAAERLYWAGGRIVDIEPTEYELQLLQADMMQAVEALGGPIVSPKLFRYRTEVMSADLVAHGWRRVPLAG